MLRERQCGRGNATAHQARCPTGAATSPRISAPEGERRPTPRTVARYLRMNASMPPVRPEKCLYLILLTGVTPSRHLLTCATMQLMAALLRLTGGRGAMSTASRARCPMFRNSESGRMRDQQERTVGGVGTQGRGRPPGQARVVAQRGAGGRASSQDEPSRRRSRRGTGGAFPVSGPGAGVGIAAVALAGPVLLGAGVDAVAGQGTGWGVVSGATAGGLLAALLAVRGRVLGWVAPLPVLAVAAVTAGSVVTSGGPPAARLVRWAVAVFPAMAAAECAVLVVALAAAVLRIGVRRARGV